VLAALVIVRQNHDAGIALAAMVPVAFLLTNRVFSPQFMIPLVASWAIAGAVLWRGAPRVAVLALLLATASTFNALVYPVLWDQWPWASAGLFAGALAATGWVVVRAVDVGTRRTDLLTTTTTNQMITGMTGKSMRG
jgi:NhaP-type Na+/H+ or K+/H+ antiporter